MKLKLQNQNSNEKGFMLIGVALAVVAIFSILIFAIQSNMNLFFANSNRSKAYYDAEIVIEKTATKMRDAYDLARRIPATFNPPNSGYLIPPANLGNLRFAGTKKFYLELPGNKFCVDRSDGFGKSPLGAGNSSICMNTADDSLDFQIDVIHSSAPVTSFQWELWRDALEFSVYKLVLDIFGPSVAYAQNPKVYRPVLPLAGGPQINLSLGQIWSGLDLKNSYGDFNCTPLASPMVSDCLLFRFCTKLNNTCANKEDFVYQRIVFRHGPVSDVEN